MAATLQATIYEWSQTLPNSFDITLIHIYYQPEVTIGKYRGMEVFLLQYFLLVNVYKMMHYNYIKMNEVG